MFRDLLDSLMSETLVQVSGTRRKLEGENQLTHMMWHMHAHAYTS